MGASLVYLGEHYVLDVLAGILCSVVAWSPALRWAGLPPAWEATVEPAPPRRALSRRSSVRMGSSPAPGSLATYEHDGFMARARPLAVCLPTETDQVAAVLRLAARAAVCR